MLLSRLAKFDCKSLFTVPPRNVYRRACRGHLASESARAGRRANVSPGELIGFMARGRGSMKNKWSRRADEYMNFLLVGNAASLLCGVLLKSRKSSGGSGLVGKNRIGRCKQVSASRVVRTVFVFLGNIDGSGDNNGKEINKYTSLILFVEINQLTLMKIFLQFCHTSNLS